jgi:glycosyl transferase family 2
MRLGNTPTKEKPQLTDYLRHRVIIPVYIPTLDGYYKDALAILKLCLESLYLTGAGKVSITVISNNSASSVVKELERFYQLGWIDQLVLNQKNRGKVDAVSSAARGAYEELITISDCDVLFNTGWLEAIEAIFHNFPECGFAAPMPNPGEAWVHTSATILGALKNRELTFDKVVPDADLDDFAYSLGWYQDQDKYLAEHRHAQMIVRRKGTTACVGGGHFVFTVRGKVVQGIPKHPSLSAISGYSEEKWLDTPPDRLGFWRLATTRAYVHHMGNTSESWMYEELENTRRNRDSADLRQLHALPEIQKSWVTKLPWRFRKGLIWAIKKPTFCRMLIPTASLKTL